MRGELQAWCELELAPVATLLPRLWEATSVDRLWVKTASVHLANVEKPLRTNFKRAILVALSEHKVGQPRATESSKYW